MNKEVQQVATVLGRGESVKLGGADFYIRPFRFGQLPTVIDEFMKLGDLMESQGSKLMAVEGEGDSAETSINIVEAFRVGSDILFKIVEIALAGQQHKFLPTDIETGEPLVDAAPIGFKAFFESEVDAEQGAKLCNVIWTINKDFFVLRVVPEMNRLLTSIGLTFAPSSLEADTTLTESESTT